MNRTLSIVIPARDEADGLARILPRLKQLFPAGEVIVVDDASSDTTVSVAESAGATVIRHPYCMGNGAAIKTGARAASGAVTVFMDADGQHSPDDVTRLCAEIENGYSMVVGARSTDSQANLFRRFANAFYNVLSSWITGHRIVDLTSGLRAVETARFREFLHLLPNGFSYPTTITMAFFRAGYPVQYVPIQAARRAGRSHIKPLRDGLRFILIIFRIGTLYSPLKIFFPISLVLAILGFINYGYTYFTQDRFTNMSALLLLASFMVFLVGLVSEQITALMYQRGGGQ